MIATHPQQKARPLTEAQRKRLEVLALRLVEADPDIRLRAARAIVQAVRR